MSSAFFMTFKAGIIAVTAFEPDGNDIRGRVIMHASRLVIQGESVDLWPLSFGVLTLPFCIH